MHGEAVVVVLFSVASAVALVARRVKLPYTVALVLAGLSLGAVPLFPAPRLTQSLLFAIFLPGLVFEAAFHLPFASFRKNALAIATLAVPGVVAAVVLGAGLLTFAVHRLGLFPGFTWVHAAVFAALIAATDPIAVVALFKSLGAPRRLVTLVDGESLLNDGTGVVLFTLVLQLAQGQTTTPAALLFQFVKAVGLGASVGAAFGYLLSQVVRRIDEPMVEITLSVIAAYGSFTTAEQLGGSGVIAAVVAGIFFGSFAATRGMSATTRIAVESFWEYLSFALNSLVFLLIGLEVRVGALVHAWRSILLAYLVVTMTRAAIVWLTAGALTRSRERIPPRWRPVLIWAGLRGALSMVLVLSLPEHFAFRQELIRMTFGTVLLSILVQGLSMKPLLSRLRLRGKGMEGQHALERARSHWEAAHVALERLPSLGSDTRFKELSRRVDEALSAPSGDEDEAL